MDFRVYIILEVPTLDKKYELLVPIDRRIHELISLLKESLPELLQTNNTNREMLIFNKITGEMYDMNQIIKNSNIKTGTRLLLI